MLDTAWSLFQTFWPLLAFFALWIAIKWYPGGDPGRY